ncbi:MAG: preprotein translocase subunit SecY [Planctomycetaceae bacterium]|jgi:preprotein translocase subunit SecY|nr:preprotein translocase subunit SecY [Planctomycetaceae bacterium]MEC9004556.1 preprotein translocase subunit SecY [Planctomycetota bacterium]
MLEKLRIVFTIPELRKKILLTLMLLAIYRVGYQITIPMVDQARLQATSGAGGGIQDFITRVSVFSASNLSQATIFGLGIMPYISASIIFQLLGSVWKPIEELKKEGEAGRKKINEYTRYVTVILCLIQSWAYVKFYLMAFDGGLLVHPDFKSLATNQLHFGWQLTAIMMMTCGTVFLMWLGEQIDEFGIGNGISLLIMAGILAQMPGALIEMFQTQVKIALTGIFSGEIGVEALALLAACFVGVVVGVVFITLGQRRIPTQSAKHVRGRRVYGGSRQYLPLRINQAGVMPIIFASSLLMVPGFLFSALSGISWATNIATPLTQVFTSQSGFIYNLFYVLMIYFFCYFWTAITFNPKEMSENLKDYGTFIPGHRPGKRTADYLERVMVRITYVGAGFLAFIAIVPTIISSLLGVSYQVSSFYGGTGLLIAVSVAFDLVQKIDSHLVMRNYTGLLEGP